MKLAFNTILNDPATQRIAESAMTIQLNDDRLAVRPECTPDNSAMLLLDQHVDAHDRSRFNFLSGHAHVDLLRGHVAARSVQVLTINAYRCPEDWMASAGASTSLAPCCSASSATRERVIVIFGGLRLNGARMRRR